MVGMRDCAFRHSSKGETKFIGHAFPESGIQINLINFNFQSEVYSETLLTKKE